MNRLDDKRISRISLNAYLLSEFALPAKDKADVAALVQRVFPEEEFRGRHYFKQLAHARILLRAGAAHPTAAPGQLLGQVGLDYRTMALNGMPIRVLGLIDVVVAPEYQGQGLGRRLLDEAEAVALAHSHNVDALFLVSDVHAFYERAGFRLTRQTVTWLAIDQHKNYGLKTQREDDCLMVKPLNGFVWPEEGELDMLGYWY